VGPHCCPGCRGQVVRGFQGLTWVIGSASRCSSTIELADSDCSEPVHGDPGANAIPSRRFRAGGALGASIAPGQLGTRTPSFDPLTEVLALPRNLKKPTTSHVCQPSTARSVAWAWRRSSSYFCRSLAWTSCIWASACARSSGVRMGIRGFHVQVREGRPGAAGRTTGRERAGVTSERRTDVRTWSGVILDHTVLLY
jgi:hypothetical protein